MKKNNLQKICILGSGGHATSCIDLIESTSKFEIIGIISQKNDKNHEKKFLNKYRIIGSDKDYKKISNICKNIVIGVSFYKDLSLRSKMFKDLKKAGFKLPVICCEPVTTKLPETLAPEYIFISLRDFISPV